MMVRQGSDSYAGLSLIPSCLDRPPNKRLEFSLKILLALEEAVLLVAGIARSSDGHAMEDRARRLGRQGPPFVSLLRRPVRIVLGAPPSHRLSLRSGKAETAPGITPRVLAIVLIGYVRASLGAIVYGHSVDVGESRHGVTSAACTVRF